MWGAICRLVSFIFRKGESSIAIDGLDKLAERFEGRLDKTEKRLDECDEDRSRLRTKQSEMEVEVGSLRGRIKICEDDRTDLRKQTNRHSLEIERLRVANEPLPQPPRRTTQERDNPSQSE